MTKIFTTHMEPPPRIHHIVLQNITTVHGMKQFSHISGLRSKLWLCLLILNTIWTALFMIVIKEKFNNDKIVTKLYSDYPVNQVPFPSVSICNYNMVSYNGSQTIVKLLLESQIPEKEIENFLRDLPALKNFSVRSRIVKNFTKIMRVLSHHYYDTEMIMEDIHQTCNKLLIYCEFNRKEKNCDDVFNMVQTYEGHCCTFNYAAIHDDVENPLLPRDEDFEYYYDHAIENRASTGIITTAQSGRNSGLRVVFNVEPDDYPSWALEAAYGAKILISDPNDYIETTVRFRYLTLGESMDLKISPVVYQAESNLRQVNPSKRGCWFPDEVRLKHSDRYSYETCRMECKMANYLKTCGCIPYKYPRDNSVRFCEMKDLTCLNNMTVFWSRKKQICDPVCFLECHDKSYTLSSDTVPFLKQYYPPTVTEGRNVRELMSIQAYFSRPTCSCYHMALLVDFNYFIATYGGVFSLSFGGSILTFIEISYVVLTSLVHGTRRIITHLVSKKYM